MPRESAFPKYWPQSKTIPESPWPLGLLAALAVAWFFWIPTGGLKGNWVFLSAWVVALADHVARYWPDVRRGYVPANYLWMTEKHTLIHCAVPFLLSTLCLLLQIAPFYLKSVVLGALAQWFYAAAGLIASADWIFLIPAAIWWIMRHGLRLAHHLYRGARS